MIKDLKEVQHRKDRQIARIKANMSSGEGSRHVIIVERKVISDQIARQNYNKIIGLTKEDWEANNSNPKDSKEDVIIVEKQDTNKMNVELG